MRRRRRLRISSYKHSSAPSWFPSTHPALLHPSRPAPTTLDEPEACWHPTLWRGGARGPSGEGGLGVPQEQKRSFIIPRDFLTRSRPLGGLGDPRKPLGCLLRNPQGSHGGASGNPRSPSAILGDARSAPGEAPRDPRKTIGVPQGKMCEQPLIFDRF